MPKTQISGAQIQDQSIQTNVFAPESIDGEIIINSSVTNEKISGDVEASKILLKDTTGNFVGKDLESALSESVTKINTVNANLTSKITNEVGTLNSTIATNKADIESQLVVKGNLLQSNIDAANNSIVANKADIEGKLGTQVSNLNSAINANKLDIENKLTNEVATLNTTILSNKSAIETDVNTKVADVQSQLDSLNSNVTGNVSAQVEALETNKAEKAGNILQDFSAKKFNVDGDIIPAQHKVHNIGGPTNRFKALYVDEAYLSTNTLYIGDTAVLGTDQETINIKADPDQSINVKTSGVGITYLTSEAGVQVSTNAMNADVKVQAAGVGSNVRMTAAREVAVTAPNINMTGDIAVTGNTQVQGLVVGGNLTVKGQVVDVQAATVQVADNILEVNKGEVGNGVTAGQAGIRVDRGQAVDYMMVFDEVDDMFKVGMQGQLEIIASQPWVQANMYVHPATHPATMITEDASHRFMNDTERAKLAGIESNANNYVHPINHAAAMIVEDPTRRFFSDTERNKLAGIAEGANNYVHPTSHSAGMIDTDSSHRFVSDAQISNWNAKSGAVVPVTTTTDGLMIASDKAKLDGIQNGAQVNQNTFGTITVDGIQVPATSQNDAFSIEAGANVLFETDVNNKKLVINNTYQYQLPATLPATMITEDTTHRFASDIEKGVWSDKYTKAEVDNKLSAYTTGLDWKESVATYADIAISYPTPVDGWTVNVKDTDITYKYNGNAWIAISANSIPLVTSTVDGKMSAADKVKLDTISANADKVETSTVNGNIKINGAEAIVYTHPTTDGSQHVPATGTTNNAKVLKAGATAGSAAWGVVDASEVSNFNEFAQDAVGLSLYDSNTVDLTYDDVNAKITADVRVDNATIEVDTTNKNIRLKDSGVVASTYTKVTVDAKGRITNGANPTTLAGYNITDAVSSTEIVTTATPNKILKMDASGNLPTGITGNAATATNVAWTGITSKPTTLAGYAITDAAPSSHVGAAGSAHAAVTTTVNGFMSAADKSKLDGITAGAQPNQNSFGNVKVGASIAAADSATDTLELVPGTNIDIALDATNDRITINNTYSYTHPATHAPSIIVQDTSNRFVTDAQISAWNAKAGVAVATTTVDGLMDSADKVKLDGIEANANNYVHPATHAPSIIAQDISNRFVTDAQISAWNAKAGVAVATTTTDGLMDSADKVKLDGIATGANNYVHPATHAPSIITQDASNRFVTDTEKSTWNAKASTAIVTTTVNGLMIAADKSKLDGIAAGANNYVHPAAHAPSIITQDASNRFVTDAQIATWNDKYTKSEVDNKFSAYSTGLDWKESVATFADIATTYPTPVDGWVVNVNDTDITYRYNGTAWIAISANSIPLATQSVDGKMSYADKVKLDGIATGANNYTHPATHAPSIIAQDASNRFVTDAEKTTWNAKASTAIATTTTDGLMDSADKVKLDGIATGANNYVHPANHPASIITQDASNRFVTDTEKSTWNAKASTAVVTTTVDGLMDSADKVKLDGIAAGANNYVHPTTHAPSIIAQDASNRFVTDTEKSTWNAKASTTVATTSANGLMSSTDKAKLDGVVAGAEVNQNAFSIISNGTTPINATAEVDTIQIVGGSNITVAADAVNKKLTIANTYSYTHPATHAPSIIAQDASNRFVTDTEKTNWNAKASTAVVTTTADGLMDSADKVKLDGIATGANNYVHPAAHAASMITEDASHRFMTDTERTKLSNCKQAMSGSSTFAGLSAAKAITLPIAMANTAYAVSIQPTEATSGNLGEVWVVKATGTITVYNTGSFVGAFDWLVLY